MKRMEVNIVADCQGRSRGYRKADLELPASPYEIEDALQRAHVPENGRYGVEGTGDWPDFLWEALWGGGPLSGGNALKELNFLADAVGRMDGIQIGAYEGAIRLCMEGKGKKTAALKELINLAFCLDDYEFHPGVTDDRILGKACMEGGMLDLVDDLPDDVAGLIDPAKVGALMRRSDHGAFTRRGYVYRSSHACREIYDGENLPACGESHSGLLSLRIEKADAPDRDSGVWLELPADGEALRWALLSIGEESFDSCWIAEAKSIIPVFQYQLAGDEDIGKLNTLAGRLQELLREPPGSLMFVKYKAVLELEQYPGLDMALDIAANLGCYDFRPDIVSTEAYGESLLQSAGIDTDDPAFSRFDFNAYGGRQLEKAGFVFTPYGAILRNGQGFVHEYTGQAQEQGEPGQGMSMGQ